MVRRHKVSFLKQNTEKDERGQERTIWQDTGLVALAKIRSVTGRLYYEAARAGEENTLLFEINYSFLPMDFNRIDYRLLFNGTQYVIKQGAGVEEGCIEAQLRGVSVK